MQFQRSIFCFIFVLLLFSSSSLKAQSKESAIPFDSLTQGEKEIFKLINEYRQSKKLSPVEFSPSLSYVARLHAKDQTHHHVYKSKCTLHSWSSDGNWSSCCYTADHKKAECMWNKPRELTRYTGDGFEISFFSTFEYDSEAAFAADALAGWKKSPGHNTVIVNLGHWNKTEWKAMGVGIHGNYINVWFGKEADSSSAE
jgi:uncharacterized protein YkwD